jgi:DNA modification methylase
MSDESVQTCITSPPYFGLRDYGCAGQLGREAAPEEYIGRLTEIFREVRRVLKPDGVFWLNIGDSYAGKGIGDTIKPKDLIGIPFRLAFALQADGWWLRSAVVWEKPNIIPQSVKDRPTNSYEFVFLLAKSQKYYYDYKAIMEPVAAVTIERMKRGVSETHKYINGASGQSAQGIYKPRKNRIGEDVEIPDMRNKRDVWRVSPTNSYRSAHFASYPPDLIRPCILAGCPPGGIVIDPFFGSGTTGVAALMEGRNYIGIDLNPEYCELARERIAKYHINK